ncbi:hypothetical protein MICABA_02639 [Microbacterium sp. T2.11-28]|nr:hypothetical protein MICABA_02639 [Microbacterium sp. T2.11-28]
MSRGASGSSPRWAASSRVRAIQPAPAPTATTSSASSSSQADGSSGMIPSTGIPGTTPRSVPPGDTVVPLPCAKPGPAAYAAPHTMWVGR